jgi:hypothetical protein
MSKQSQRNRRDRVQRSIYHDLPRHARHLQTGRFGAWIRLGGGKCLHTTNPYEVARWKSLDRMATCVIYKKADGTLTWTVNAADDYRDFLKDCGA